MNNKDTKKPGVVLHLLPAAQEEEEFSTDEELEYPAHHIDLQEVCKHVDSADTLEGKFEVMFSCVQDNGMVDCNITDRGFNLYTEDEDNMYVFTVIKKR